MTHMTKPLGNLGSSRGLYLTSDQRQRSERISVFVFWKPTRGRREAQPVSAGEWLTATGQNQSTTAHEVPGHTLMPYRRRDSAPLLIWFSEPHRRRRFAPGYYADRRRRCGTPNSKMQWGDHAQSIRVGSRVHKVAGKAATLPTQCGMSYLSLNVPSALQ